MFQCIAIDEEKLDGVVIGSDGKTGVCAIEFTIDDGAAVHVFEVGECGFF